MDTFKIKKGLGRGLSSLIGETKSKGKINKVAISNLVRNKYQPRKVFNKESLEELTSSIKERGVIQPIIVRSVENDDNKYEIVAGERRWLASQKAGLNEIPVVVIKADDLKSLEFSIVENVQRHDLNPIEEAQGYQKLIDEFFYDQEKISKFIGKSRSHVANCLRLLNLPNEVILYVENESISAGHAKILVGLENAGFLAKKIKDENLSVRQTENLVRALKNKNNLKIIKKIDPNILEIENTLESSTGINVKIKNKKNNSGNISFEYKNVEQLNRLIEAIKKYY